MKKGLLLTLACMMLGVSVQAKEFKYETVPGDMMQTRIYTLDNGLKRISLCKPRETAYPDVHRCTYRF